MRTANLRSLLLTTTLCLGLSGCIAGQTPNAPGGEGEAAAPLLLVEVELGETLTVESTLPVSVGRTEPASGTFRLRYEVVEAGVVIAAGEIDDPRVYRSEFDLAGDVDPQRVVTAGRVELVVPNVTGELRLLDGEVELGHAALRASSGVSGARSALLDQELDVDPPVVVVDNPDAVFTILVLPEGFTADEMPEFEARADTLIEALSALPDYADRWADFRVVRQVVRSRESGIDDPRTESEVDTAFDVSFGPPDLRRCTTPSTIQARSAIARLRRAAEADAVMIMSNTTEHSGCASFTGRWFVGSAYSATAGDTVGHELGHSLFGLADEYTTPYPGRGCNEDHHLGRPNVAGTLEGDLPWQDLLTTDEIPTSTPGHVGAYQGGNYCAENRWRPENNCRMRQSGTAFCRVCRHVFERRIEERRAEIEEQARREEEERLEEEARREEQERLEEEARREEAMREGELCADVYRLAGATRFETAVAIGQTAVNRGSIAFLINGENVVVDPTDPLIDADDRPVSTYPQGPGIGAAPLARALGAPVLLVGRDTAPAETLNALAEWGTAVVFIVGGPDAVGPGVEAAVRAIDTVRNVSRYDGDTVAEVAAEVASQFPAPTTAFLISHSPRAIADNLAGAAAAAILGAPILYTGRDEIPAATREYFDAHAETLETVYVIGGTAVVRPSVVSQLTGAVRVAGESRNETAARIAEVLAEEHRHAIDRVLLVNSERPADGLSAASLGVPTLFSTLDELPAVTRDAMVARGVSRVTVIGGTAAISDTVETALCESTTL